MSCPAQARIHRHTQYGGRVRNGDPVPTIACPLAGCSEQPELHHAKNKRATPYITCGAWGNSTVWFRSPASNEFLNANNGGGPIRTNPAEGPTVFEQRAARAGFDPPPESLEDAESPEPEP